jgi:hypothetical protein
VLPPAIETEMALKQLASDRKLDEFIRWRCLDTSRR